jgi:hypothetical protein
VRAPLSKDWDADASPSGALPFLLRPLLPMAISYATSSHVPRQNKLQKRASSMVFQSSSASARISYRLAASLGAVCLDCGPLTSFNRRNNRNRRKQAPCQGAHGGALREEGGISRAILGLECIPSNKYSDSSYFSGGENCWRGATVRCASCNRDMMQLGQNRIPFQGATALTKRTLRKFEAAEGIKRPQTRPNLQHVASGAHVSRQHVMASAMTQPRSVSSTMAELKKQGK